jgi:hypothetical protein
MLRALLGVIFALVLLGRAPLRAQDDPASRRAAIEMMYPVMIQALEAKAFGRARNICEQAILWEPQNPIHHYNLACIEAQAGRVPQAIGALELAVALGFHEPGHLQNDPDLLPIRNEPKFAELARKVADNAFGPSAPPGSAGAVGPDIVAKSASKSPAPGPAARPASATQPEAPAKNSFNNGRPVGLFFMTRFWPATRSLEKAAWYFAPDGTVYQNLESGFSAEDLAAHGGPKGTCSIAGDKLEVTWADAKKTSSTIKRSASGTGFSWNAGIFSAVKAFEKMADVAGTYEGGESLAGSSGNAVVSKRLALRADGTFEWSGVSFASAASNASRVSVGGTGASTGRWQLSGMSLILTDANGTVLRRIVFPYDDDTTPLKPDRMFFGGILYKRLP